MNIVKKNRWKKWAAVLSAAAIAVTLTACMPNMMGMQNNKEPESLALDKNALQEMDLNAFYSEENGYSFHGVKWHSTPDEVEKQLGYPMGEPVDLKNSSITCYRPEAAAELILGRVCSVVELAFNEEDKLYNVSFQYSAGHEMDSAGLDVFVTELVAEFEKLYGEYTVASETSQLPTVEMHSTTYKWELPIGNDMYSSLQVAFANTTTEDTDIVVVGVVGYTAEERAREMEKE